MDRIKSIYLAILLMLITSAVLLVAAPANAADVKSRSEAPMTVVTQGLTAEQHREQQAELSRRLLTELPAAATKAAIRIPLTAEEVSALDNASKSEVPLKIGTVKPVGRPIEVSAVTRSSLARETLRGKTAIAVPTLEGGFTWGAVFISENAGAIRLHVENMSLPNHVELYLYSRDGQAYGPYTGKGPDGTGEFWTETIFGSEAILQLRGASNADVRGISFKVREAGLITPKFAGSISAAASGFCGNASCVVDASCYSGIADTLQLAGAKMEWVAGAYIYSCTGGLINDNNPTQNNFFLTANHCISKNSNAKNINFYWRFATSSCNGSCPKNSGWPYQTHGATVSATGRRGDFSLLHLNSGPPSGSVRLGWTTAGVANTSGKNLYRVSNPNFGPQVYSTHRVDTSAPTCTGWPRGQRIYSRDITGAIAGGSSGSPVTNSNAQIVGQLSGTCGTKPSNVCLSGPGESNATVDGAFAYYYGSVKPYLNP